MNATNIQLSMSTVTFPRKFQWTSVDREFMEATKKLILSPCTKGVDGRKRMNAEEISRDEG